MILVFTPDVSHQEQLTVILHCVLCDPGKEATAILANFGDFGVNDNSSKGLSDIFLEWAKDLLQTILEDTESNDLLCHLASNSRNKRQARDVIPTRFSCWDTFVYSFFIIPLVYITC